MSISVIDREALLDHGDVHTLADRLGMTQQQIQRMLDSGKVRDETLWNIADTLEVPILTLLPYRMGRLTTGQSLHLARLEAYLTIEELSDLCGLSVQTLVRYENDSMPKLDQAQQIAKALEMTVDDVFFCTL